MFTGIVQNLGEIQKIQIGKAGLTLQISGKLAQKDLKRGTSVLVDGVCLTVENFDKRSKRFTVTLVPETLSKTFFSTLRSGQKVNLEPSLRLGDPLGGHFVLGHVDFVGKIVKQTPLLKIAVPPPWMKFFPNKGSFTLNGVSLTIAAREKNEISVALIPETLKKTNLGLLKKGDFLHVEIDALARYLSTLNPSL